MYEIRCCNDKDQIQDQPIDDRDQLTLLKEKRCKFLPIYACKQKRQLIKEIQSAKNNEEFAAYRLSTLTGGVSFIC